VNLSRVFSHIAWLDVPVTFLFFFCCFFFLRITLLLTSVCFQMLPKLSIAGHLSQSSWHTVPQVHFCDSETSVTEDSMHPWNGRWRYWRPCSKKNRSMMCWKHCYVWSVENCCHLCSLIVLCGVRNLSLWEMTAAPLPYLEQCPAQHRREEWFHRRAPPMMTWLPA